MLFWLLGRMVLVMGAGVQVAGSQIHVWVKLSDGSWVQFSEYQGQLMLAGMWVQRAE